MKFYTYEPLPLKEVFQKMDIVRLIPFLFWHQRLDDFFIWWKHYFAFSI
jgi:hypothetical protein